MSRRVTKLVREGDYVAEIEVELRDEPEGWGPYLAASDAQRLDEVRGALRRGDFEAARQLGRIYRLTAVWATASGGRRRKRRGACLACGSDLRMNETGICPECGAGEVGVNAASGRASTPPSL